MEDYDVFDMMSREGPVSTYLKNVGKVSGHDYMKFEKGKDGRITYMTGDDYIQHCIDDVFRSSREAVVDRAVAEYKVHDYARHMLQGEKFPPVYLDYVSHQQEGRHRALAFKEAFGSSAKLPVLEIFSTKTTLPEIYDYCKRKYGSLASSFMESVAKGLGFDDKEIYDYMGWDYQPPPVEKSEDANNAENIEDIDIDDEMLDDAFLEDAEAEAAEYYGITVAELQALPLSEYTRKFDKFLEKKYSS